jgi:hypothetical protein
MGRAPNFIHFFFSGHNTIVIDSHHLLIYGHHFAARDGLRPFLGSNTPPPCSCGCGEGAGAGAGAGAAGCFGGAASAAVVLMVEIPDHHTYIHIEKEMQVYLHLAGPLTYIHTRRVPT